MRLKNKIAFITGGTQSIGKAIATLFLQEGATVIISGSRDQKEGTLIAESLGATVTYYTLDVANEVQWQNVMDNINQRYGRLDILINNAGIEYPAQSDPDLQNPENCSLADWKRVHEVNVESIFLGCKYALSLLKKSKAASIINMGSRSALVGVPASAAYSSSKAAVRNYTKTIAIYCANQGYSIRCNVIHPAAIATHMWDKELGIDEKRAQRAKAFAQKIPLRRMGTANDIAYATVYFASDESLFVTGTELIIDGGIMAATAAGAQVGLIEE